MEAIQALVQLSNARAAPPQLPVHEGVWQRILDLSASTEDVAVTWRAALEADDARSWPDPILRAVVLAVIGALVELHHVDRHSALAASLGKFHTRSGAPLRVIGTRCEAFGRAAEALFLEGRRKPGDPLFNMMLTVSEALFSVVMADCRQRDDPKFMRSWLGMRGVCRLMLLVHGKASANAERLSRIAKDLLDAYELGNRGPSAAHSTDRGHPFQADRGQRSGRSRTPLGEGLSDGWDRSAGVRHHGGTLSAISVERPSRVIHAAPPGRRVGNPVPKAFWRLG